MSLVFFGADLHLGHKISQSTDLKKIDTAVKHDE